MNKRELVAETARRSGLTQGEVRDVLDALVEVIGETLAAGDAVTLGGLGRFEIKVYSGRVIRHPRTRKPVRTRSRRLPAFHPYPLLKERVGKEGDTQESA
ncbi:MAG: HU family DNA-binding protein [Anaerolineae bacterium]|nr:HU family DNA-binding protein [Anaerolineae bacterium]